MSCVHTCISNCVLSQSFPRSLVGQIAKIKIVFSNASVKFSPSTQKRLRLRQVLFDADVAPVQQFEDTLLPSSTTNWFGIRQKKHVRSLHSLQSHSFRSCFLHPTNSNAAIISINLSFRSLLNSTNKSHSNSMVLAQRFWSRLHLSHQKSVSTTVVRILLGTRSHLCHGWQN